MWVQTQASSLHCRFTHGAQPLVLYKVNCIHSKLCLDLFVVHIRCLPDSTDYQRALGKREAVAVLEKKADLFSFHFSEGLAILFKDKKEKIMLKGRSRSVFTFLNLEKQRMLVSPLLLSSGKASPQALWSQWNSRTREVFKREDGGGDWQERNAGRR